MPFDPTNERLENSNLIEASAGTGKTYSIAIMALRLLVEKEIQIQEILMVTFTKAAVAELELRVRAFVRLALNVSRGETIHDATITEVVKNAIRVHGQKKIEEKLYHSVLLLDETSVLTIHSFCQQVLKEYSFETSQIFGAEAISPDEFNQQVEDSFNEYWRKKITTLDPQLLTLMLEHEFTREALLKVVKGGLDGKVPVAPGGVPADFLSPAVQQKLVKDKTDKDARIAELKDKILTCLNAWQNDLPERIKKGKTNAINAFGHLTEPTDRISLYNAILEKWKVGYLKTCFGDAFAADVVEMNGLLTDEDTNITLLIARIGVDAFAHVKREVGISKDSKGQITFDDMITSVSRALSNQSNKAKLTLALTKKYKAVFIDEFQDTDKDQYFIFHTLFGEGTPLFYIGDPKQSIYGWRKADIATYFKAKAQVTTEYSMNVNYRSTAAYIRSMNQFFLPEPGFDTFAYNGAPDSIQYIPVESPEPNTKGSLHGKETVPVALRISAHSNKKELKKAIKMLMHHLLFSGVYQITKKNKPAPLAASNIGILVRTNKEAKEVKSILSSLGIPAVTIDDAKLFHTAEAKELYFVLMAVLDHKINSINRALLTKIGAFTPETLAAADKEAIIERFRTYQETWKKEGVYVMLRQFLSDHKLNERFYDDTIGNPERFVANTLQLVEIIHKVSERKNYDPLDQVQWFKKGLDGELREGDEYQQRLEQDEEAVKIVTIHKSKGLEYDVVIAPFLDFKSKLGPKTKSFSYRVPETGEYVVVNSSLASAEQVRDYETQTEQENRRLLYVAITRARYQCYILTSKGEKESTLQKFYSPIEAAKKADPNAMPDIELWSIPEVDRFVRRSNTSSASIQYAVAHHFELTEKYWRKASFTALSPEHQTLAIPRYEGISNEEYDKFIFRDLKKGAQTGNLLHYIFETIDFTKADYWPKVIEKAVKRLASNHSPEFLGKLNEFVHQILDTNLPLGDGFELNQIPLSDRLTELEFDFPLQQINMREIEKLSTPNAPLFVRNNDEMEGIMTGKIDLFFRHNGKYYILDWKSNYLGETAADYSSEKMQEAMNENNYHLQYHIYSVAANKYLSSRLPDWDYDQGFGGVIYLFVRGVRKGSNTGIYLARPEKDHVEKLSIRLSGK